ncbi:superoxide dismutase family protein [Sphingomonas lacunae]|uniref:Superoxide dismutase family protein n=1 Tax=Sphingomonas lacunae TaxID=2698828 RepID=A0A6M4ATM8_9SPHN|nr:superoxide dismutase family protein [Sphingomonas lacunae]QJQ32467.1 superoxide dismutase family protein [Sphingomonas lacunae]
MRYAAPTLILAALTLAGCATTGPVVPAPLATGTLARADGSAVGMISVTPMAGHMHVHMRVSGFAPGTYGTHLHTTGLCEGPAFTSAGGHLNPGGAQHGRLNPAGAHMGDLPNLVIGADGTGTLDYMANVTAEALFDADGTAAIIHAVADDERTDPTGNSGARIICAVLNRAG